MLEKAKFALAPINGAAKCDSNRNTHNKQESGHNEIRDSDTIPAKLGETNRDAITPGTNQHAPEWATRPPHY